MITLQNINKTYKNGVSALKDVNIQIDHGEFVYVIGPTGCGKSTLIKIINGEEIPTNGTAVVNKINVGKLKHSKVPLYRRNIGVVFQDYRLLSHKKVIENISFAMECIGKTNDEIRRRVREVLKLVDLADKGRSYPRELSGGQQQRVAIARAIANNPKVLIADEPTGNLDAAKAREIMELITKINVEEKTTILVVTHDMSLVERFPNRTITLDNGRVVSDTGKVDKTKESSEA